MQHLETTPPAPAVVAVVVTCDPGPWVQEALDSLAFQDYPNLSVLVIDSASERDPTPEVAASFEGAFVTRLDRRVGFGRAANEVIKLVEGASHYLFCHDDVALAPDAVRLLVEQAFRSNAGIATPKYVQWDHPERLLAVGATADKVGVIQDLVDPGELDQEQHDAVRDVLVAPGGATLIRADLFRALGGFNATIDQFGEDLDLSWRARIAGARVVAVPQARVRHLQAVKNGFRDGWETPLARRRTSRSTDEHRIRTLLTCYRWLNLMWIVPLAFLYVLGEAATRLLQGRPGDAAGVLTSFGAAMRRPGKLWRSRRRVQRRRTVGDGEIRRLQARGNARLRASIRAWVEDVREGLPPAPVTEPARDGDLDEFDMKRSPQRGPSFAVRVSAARARRASTRRPPTPAPGTGVSTSWRVTVLVVVVLAAILVFGSRSLLGHALPAVGQLPNTSGGWGHLWRAWWSTWQPGGLGVTAPSSPALALLGLLATVLFGAVGTLQHVVVLGALLVGPLGAYRAARWWGSRRGRLAALITYALVPLPYNALARGHWQGLVAYAAAPWVIGGIARISGEVPFPTTRVGRIAGRVIGLGVLIAATASVAPSWLWVVPLAGIGLVAGSSLAGRPAQGLRMLAVAVTATVTSIVLLLPWSAWVLGSGTSTLGVGTSPTIAFGLGQILRFDTGPVGKGPLGWALLIAAALPLVIGRGWRLEWATRLWAVAILFFWITWAGSRGWIPSLPPEVSLAPAAAALAGSVALGAVAFELDLPGYRFGWRQLAAGVAAAALALSAIPMLIASGDGRWKMPTADASAVLSFLPDGKTAGYRVLWVGAPDAIPMAGQRLSSGIEYATSYNGEPDVVDTWAAGSQGATPELGADLRLAQDRLTTKLGHLLSPMSVLYLVIPNHNAPSGSGGVSVPTPNALLASLPLQTDLQLVNVDPNYVVYKNASWAPARTVLPAGAYAAAAASGAEARKLLQETDLAGSPAVFTSGDARSSQPVGSVLPQGSTVYVSATRDSAWKLSVDGHGVSRQPAFGWAMRFQLPASGIDAAASATLTRSSSISLHVVQVGEIIAVLIAIGLAAVDLRMRRSEHPPTETVRPEWFSPLAPATERPPWRRGGRGTLGSEDLSGDEVWIDV